MSCSALAIRRRTALQTRIFYYARSTKDGIVFLRKTEKGFNAMRYSDGKETTLKEFEGAFGTDYLLSGDVLIGKNGIVYNLATQKEQAFDAPGIKALAAAAVSPDGKRIGLGGRAGKRRGK